MTRLLSVLGGIAMGCSFPEVLDMTVPVLIERYNTHRTMLPIIVCMKRLV